ncbi:uncharacterized protein C8Q71DRAFT_418857 [Rhodofomes roseus]|uniref:Transcription factor TFIIIC triple barrel domain-containing protein n=1 Tax=Rhodofomes roseus TaxID=34475 RepID=A0ABQ8KPX6_9APHY|nr:uncharacterized protein C8Q71DRAFT_418857 [Rhodofomes roseus]KAH9840666.1 hypothetical protein C8Q71DRAFT_418857 [Rhodofomes roseus]
MGKQSIASGYKYVDAFGPDEEYESEEEVVYVTLDLGAVEPALVPSSSSFRLIGLDTPSPFLQLSGTVFKGQHQSLLGTELLFTDAKDDQADRTRKPLVHVGTSEQRIRFREVEVKAKTNKLPEVVERVPVNPQPKGKNNKKDRLPETVQEVVGTVDAVQPRRRRGRRPKDQGKGKEKAVEHVEESVDVDDPMEGPSATITPSRASSRENAAGDVAGGNAPHELQMTDASASVRQDDSPRVQWSSDAPQGSTSVSMEVDTSYVT